MGAPELSASYARGHEDLTLPQWREVIAGSFAALEITSPSESSFRGSVREVALGDVHMFDMVADPQTVVRTAELVEQDQGEYFKLSLQLEGECTLRQDGRECVLRPGDLGLYVAYRPYELVYSQPWHGMIMTFPLAVVNMSADQVALVTARAITKDHGLGRVAVPMFQELAANMDILQGPHAMRLVRSALSMLVSVLSAEALELTPAPASDLLLHQAMAYIEDHLGDPELSPGSIARALYVSVRQLHSRFAAQNQTVATTIRTMRLEAIREDLANPALVHETVHSLSIRHGLMDPAHVSKAFKAEFGEAPSTYRRRILG